MTCPRCSCEFIKGPSTCPECGIRLVRTVSGVIKTSAVMIAGAGEPEFFGSVQEVPEPLRTQLIAVTTGRNSGTIVIADEAGKDQITQVVTRRETRAKGKTDGSPALVGAWSRMHWLAWTGAAAVLLAGGAIAALFLGR